MRQSAAKKSIRITITTTEQVRKLLVALVDLGLYGTSISDVAERLVCEGLRSDVKRKRALLTDPTPKEVE